MIAMLVWATDSLKIIELQQRIHDLELQTRSFWDAMPTGIGWIAVVLAVVLGVLTWVVGYNAWKAVQTPKEIRDTLEDFRGQMADFRSQMAFVDEAIKTNLKSIANVFRYKAVDAVISKDRFEEIDNLLHVIVLTGDASERLEMIDHLMERLDKHHDQLIAELDKDKQLRIAVFEQRLYTIPSRLTEEEKSKIKMLEEKLRAIQDSLMGEEPS